MTLSHTRLKILTILGDEDLREKKDDCNMEIHGLTTNRDLDSLGNDESVPLPFARNFQEG